MVKKNKMPVFYGLVAVMAIIVIFIMIFGGGREVFLDQKQITFTLAGYEEIVAEDDPSSTDNIILSAKEFKSRISVDPVYISNYDDFIKELKKKKVTIKASINTDDEPLLMEDEIISGENIIINGKDFSVKDTKE